MTSILTVVSFASGDLVSHFSVQADQEDSNPNNNDASLTTVVSLPAATGRGADMAITSLTTNATEIPIGFDMEYQFVVANRGDSEATNVVLDVTLPDDVTVFRAVTNTVLFPGQRSSAQIGNHLYLYMPNFLPGATSTAEMLLTPSKVGNYHLSAVLRSDQIEVDIDNNSAAVDVAVVPPPPPTPGSVDLEMTRYDSTPSPARSGQLWTHTYTITNKSSVNTATNVRVYELPNPYFQTFVSTDAPGGLTRNGDVFIYGVGTLAPGESKTFTVTMIIDSHSPRPIIFTGANFVVGDQLDPNSSNDVGRESALVLAANADLELQVSAAEAVAAGSDVTYTITVKNHGESTASSAEIRFVLPDPDDAAFVSASVPNVTQVGGMLTLSLGDLASDATATINVTLRALHPGKIVVGAVASSRTFDPEFSNNLGITTVTVVPPGSPVLLDKPDLEITTLTANPDPAVVGAPLTYTIVVRNRGGVTATGVRLIDGLPDGVRLFSAAASQGNVAVSGSTIHVDLGSLASDASATITIVVTPDVVGNLRNEVGISMNEVDPFPSDNRASITTQVKPVPPAVTGADLVVRNMGAPNPATEGSILTYTLQVANNGPDAASRVVLADVLPDDAIFLSGSATQGSLRFDSATHTVSFELGTLLNGQSATATVQISAAKRGIFLSQATVTSATADPNTENNLALEKIPVLGPGDTCASMVADLNVTNASAFDDPLGILSIGRYSRDAVVMDGIAYFSAGDGIHSTELWRSDGTDAGTYLVKDIDPNGSSGLRAFEIHGHKLYFYADDGTTGDRVWVSDGTAAGTHPVPSFGSPLPGLYRTPLGQIGDTTLFILRSNATTIELWKQGSADASPVFYRSIAAGNGPPFEKCKLSVGGYVYFLLNDGASGRELWRTDGTSGGTSLVKTLGTPTSSVRGDSRMFALGDLLFTIDWTQSSTYEMWATNIGTGVSTLLHTFVSNAPNNLVTFQGKLYFLAVDDSLYPALWVSDGTLAGTQVVRNFINGPNGVFAPQDLTVLNGALTFFVVNGGIYAYQPVQLELWKSDGTNAGTTLVKDIGVDPQRGSYSAKFKPMVLGGLLYFAFTDGDNGLELFTTDGTAAGTRKLTDLNPNGGSNPSLPLAVGSRLFFRANDGTHGFEMWQTDGTPSGTTLIHDIAIGTNDGSPAFLGVLGGKVLVLNQITDKNLALFSTDGTAAGTSLVKDLNSRPQDPSTLLQTGAPTSSAIVNGKLYFTTGSKLWVTDGSTSGTTLVKDFTNEPLGIQPDLLQAGSGRFFFITSTYGSGATPSRTIWTSDGVQTTALGTFVDNSFSRTLAVVGDKAFFRVCSIIG